MNASTLKAYRKHRAAGHAAKFALSMARADECTPTECVDYTNEDSDEFPELAELPDGYAIRHTFEHDLDFTLEDFMGDTFNGFSMFDSRYGERPDGHAGIDYVNVGGSDYVETPRELFDEWVSYRHSRGMHKSVAMDEARDAMDDNAWYFYRLHTGEISPMVMASTLIGPDGEEVETEYIGGIGSTDEDRKYSLHDYGIEHRCTLIERAKEDHVGTVLNIG